jgi:hypothetical protein
MVRGIADEAGLLDNLRSILAAARAAGVQVFFVPHRRLEPGDYKYVLADPKLLARNHIRCPCERRAHQTISPFVARIIP